MLWVLAGLLIAFNPAWIAWASSHSTGTKLRVGAQVVLLAAAGWVKRRLCRRARELEEE